jgi:hypothetical protein
VLARTSFALFVAQQPRYSQVPSYRILLGNTANQQPLASAGPLAHSVERFAMNLLIRLYLDRIPGASSPVNSFSCKYRNYFGNALEDAPESRKLGSPPTKAIRSYPIGRCLDR